MVDVGILATVVYMEPVKCMHLEHSLFTSRASGFETLRLFNCLLTVSMNVVSCYIASLAQCCLTNHKFYFLT